MEAVIEKYKDGKGFSTDVEMQAEDWQAIIASFKGMVNFPEDPFEQLRAAVEAVFKSWHTPRRCSRTSMSAIFSRHRPGSVTPM